MTKKILVALGISCCVLAGRQAHAGQTVQTPPPTQPGVGEQPQLPPPVPPRRPYRGLFGAGDGRQSADGLSASVSAFGGYDDNVISDQAGSVGSRQPVAGTFGGVNGSLGYRVSRDRSSLTAVGSSQARFYEEGVAPNNVSYSGALSGILPMGRRLTLNARQGVAYSPYYQLNLLPDLPSIEGGDVQAPDPPNLDDSISALTTYRYDTDVSLAQTVGRSSMLRYAAGLRVADFEESSGLHDSRAYSAGMLFSKRVSRYGLLRLGYTYQENRTGPDALDRARIHHIDLGGGYSRPLSFSRRTTVSFSGGTALVQAGIGNQWRFMGDGSVHHELGRTWLARLAFRQGMEFIEVLPDPLQTRSVRVSLGGLLSRRADLRFDAGYTTGQSNSGNTGAGFATRYGSARFQFAITETLAWYSEYAYNLYDFDEGIGLPGAVRSEFERHAVRTGISLWIPLFTPRQVNASR